MRLRCHIVYPLVVVAQLRQRADEVGAEGEYAQLCHALAPLVLEHMQPLVHRHPAIQPVVARFGEGNTVLCEYIRHAPPGLLPCSPQVGRREIGRDLVLANHVQYPFRRLAYDESLCALAEIPALTYLAHGVRHVVLVDRDEVGRQHVEAVVHGHIAPPPRRHLEWFHHMHVPVPLAEILARENVPGAIEPGLAQLIGQGFKHVDILGVPLHEHGVVCNLCLDEFVVVRPLVAMV